jgi:uncharacterized protein DUF5317
LKLPKLPYWYLLVVPFLSPFLGVAINALVMAANHSQMPVNMPPGMEIDPSDWVHTAMTAQTHLKFLCDWIVLRGVGIASPADLLIWLGEYTQVPAFFVWLTLIAKDTTKV